MTKLPEKAVLNGEKIPTTTTSEMKNALADLRDYLNELLGDDSMDKAAARRALGVETELAKKADQTQLSGYLPLSGGTMTGNLYAGDDQNCLFCSSPWGLYQSLGFYNNEADTRFYRSVALLSGGDASNYARYSFSREGKIYVDGAPGGKEGGFEMRVVTNTYRDGFNWYRKWSDGWLEEGGMQAGSTFTGAFNYLVPFAARPTVTATMADQVGGTYPSAVFVGQAGGDGSTCRYTLVGQSGGDYSFFWYACGQAAS